jgi:hypothetical protein
VKDNDDFEQIARCDETESAEENADSSGSAPADEHH